MRAEQPLRPRLRRRDRLEHVRTLQVGLRGRLAGHLPASRPGQLRDSVRLGLGGVHRGQSALVFQNK